MYEKIDLKNVSEWWYLVNMILKNKDISSDNDKNWNMLNKYFKEIDAYFSVLNYELKIDSDNWFAYVEMIENSESESLSKVQKMSFWVTLLLVILREYIYKKEVEDIYVDVYRISYEYIKENLTVYLREKYENDEKRIASEIKTILNKTQETWILSQISNDDFRINKLIKAKISTDDIEKIFDMIRWELGMDLENKHD